MKPLIPLLLCLSLAQSLPIHPSSLTLTNNQIINSVFYGVFSANNLSKPIFCLDCIDDASAKRVVLFVNQILPKISKLLPPFFSLKKQVMDFLQSFDGAMITCLGYSYEIQFLGEKYTIQAGSSVADIEHYFIHYFEFHYEKAHKSIKHSDELWGKGQYEEFGVHWAKFVHQVLDPKGEQDVMAVE